MLIRLSLRCNLTPFHQIWNTSTLSLLYIIHPHGETEAGDIFSLAYSSPPGSGDAPGLNALFLGCQNTSLQWLDLSRPGDYLIPGDTGSSTPNLASDGNGRGTPEIVSMGLENSTVPSPAGLRKLHKFFDSQPRAASRTRVSDSTIPTISPPAENAGPVSFGPCTDIASICIPRPSPSTSLGGDLTGVPSSSGTSKQSSISSLSGLLLTPINETGRLNNASSSPRTLQVPPENVIESAHFGCV